MAKSHQRPLRGLPLEEVIDRLGIVRAKITALTGEESALKNELTARRVGEGEGRQFRFILVTANRTILDIGKLRLEFGDDWVDARCIARIVTSFRTVPRLEALAGAA